MGVHHFALLRGGGWGLTWGLRLIKNKFPSQKAFVGKTNKPCIDNKTTRPFTCTSNVLNLLRKGANTPVIMPAKHSDHIMSFHNE